MKQDFDTLNPQQQAAATHSKGHALVLAGAGSGKTTTLAYRLLYLLQTGTKGKNICAVTFTNKAARELRERVEKIASQKDVQDEATQIWALTFHSLAFRMLQYSGEAIGLPTNWSVADREDSLKILTKVLKKQEIDVKPAAVLNLISLQKNRGLMLEQTNGLFLADSNHDFKPTWQEYQYGLLQSGKLDFDDLILSGLQLLKTPTGENWIKKFNHILVDEYQDTNPVQELFLEMLVGKKNNLWAVGDELQVLYGFRLANVDRILQFPTKWSGKQYPLEYNYRSTKKIIDAANGVVENSKERTDKKLKATKEEGENVKYFACSDPDIEAKAIAQHLKPKTGKDKTQTCAVLYRQHSQSRSIEHELNRSRIKYVIRGGLSFYNRAEIKHSRALLHLLNNPSDRLAAERILLLQEGFGQASFAKLVAWADAQDVPILETMFAADKILKGKSAAAAKRIAAAYLTVIKSKDSLLTSWRKLSISADLLKWANSEKEKAEDRKGNLSEFENLLAETNEKPWKETIVDFLQLCSLDEHDDVSEGLDEIEPVVLSTIHAAKGLEWDTVWVAGIEQDLFIREPGDEEEARRLVHVAMTRAKSSLNLSANAQRMQWGTIQKSGSVYFLNEISSLLEKAQISSNHNNQNPRERGTGQKSAVSSEQKAKIDSWLKGRKPQANKANGKVTFVSGEKVFHAKFGNGTVIKDDGTQIKVNFGAGPRTLLKEYAGLKKL